jgi:hypothetical protein
MGLLSRLKTGLVLTKDSLTVIRHYPKLLVFPLLSGVAGLAFLGLFFGLTVGFLEFELNAVTGGLLLVVYLGLTFISSFFSAALVHQARQCFEDQPVSLRAGVAAAWEQAAPIFVWSLIAATVGLLINAIENSDSLPARIVGSLFGLAWTVLTFLVIPVIVFERTSTVEMFKRSGGLFKQTWGETPISLLAVTLVSALVAIPVALVGLAVAQAGLAPVGIGVILVGVLLGFLISQTLQGVVKTALYVYATEGKTPEEFGDLDPGSLPDDRRNSASGFDGGTGPNSGGFR